jgi:multiple sugar transport system permease protein
MLHAAAKKRRPRGWCWTVLALGVAALDLLPLALVTKQAFTPESESLAWPPTWWPRELTLAHFTTAGDSLRLAEGLWLSLSVALLTVALTLTLVLPAAWMAARSERGDRALDAGVLVARLFPPLALAVPLGAIFVRLGLYNHPDGLGLWLAHTLLGIPFAFFILRGAFRELPVDLEEAARLDGAGSFGVFWHVSLPLVRPSLAAAAMLVFLVSWDEFAYALLLQVTNRPLTGLVYYFSAFGHPGLASAVAVIMVVPAIVVLVLLLPALRGGALAGSGR